MNNYGLIGKPLGHSFSPQIHSMLSDYKYDLFCLDENEVEAFIINKMKASHEIQGINVTIPYKKTVMPFCDIISDEAKEIGCVNTVVNKNGQIIGYNTDAYGMEYMIRRSRIDIKGKNVLILGDGATALTARYVMNKLNARKIIHVSRKGRITFKILENEKEHELSKQAFLSEIIINTTPVGMYPNNQGKLIDLNDFNSCVAVFDVIYNPFNTKLLMQAKKLKITCGNGLSMLVAQAKKASEYFTGAIIDDLIIEKIHDTLKSKLMNIVLIGMSGCGKSTIGYELAKRLNRSFIDSDEEIEKETQMSIPEIFSEFKESGFRQLEEDIINNISKCSGQIISTGGGVILRDKNMDNLKQNGKIFWIRRSVARLPLRGNRPLSSDRETLTKMYNARKPLYKKYSDVIIDNNSSIDNAVNQIMNEMEIK